MRPKQANRQTPRGCRRLCPIGACKLRSRSVVWTCGLPLEEEWSSAQRQTFIKLAEAACKKLATRESIPAEEIVSWPLADELRIFPPGAKEILTAPVIERGRAVWLVSSNAVNSDPLGVEYFHGDHRIYSGTGFGGCKSAAACRS